MWSEKKFVWASILTALSVSVVLCAFAVWFGALNQDEGWYLYAAKMVKQGFLPYRDFFFTQGPTLPLVYGWLHPLWLEGGVLGGRIFTAAIGLLAAALTGLLAGRAVERKNAPIAWVIAFSLCACNLYHVYFTTIPKTYALASLLLTLSFLALSFCGKGRSSIGFALFAGFAAALAGGTRVSLLFALPPTALLLLIFRRELGSTWLFYGLGAVAGVAAVFGWAIWLAPEEFIFSQTFHVGRSGGGLMYVAGSLSRTVRAYAALFALLIAVAGLRLALCGGWRSSVRPSRSFFSVLWFCAGVTVAVVQLTSPHPYDDYQVPIMGLLAASCAVWCVNLPMNAAGIRILGLGAVLVSCMLSFASSMIQDWFVVRQDRFWTVMSKQSAMSQLRMAAEKIRSHGGGDGVLLTQDAYLAVEAGMELPRGMEMGPFSYFPELTDEAAAKHHVLNGKSLAEALRSSPAKVCAFSEYSWAIASPSTDPVPELSRAGYLEIIERGFDKREELADFGQNHTLLKIYERKDENR